MRTTNALRLGLLLVLSALLAACGSAGAPIAGLAPTSAAAGSKPTSRPATATTPPTTAAPPATAQPAATAAPQASIAQGLTPEGYHYLGRADAPVTITNYSDFL